MMRSSLLRHAAATRVALAVRPAQAAFRASSGALALSRGPRAATAVYRPANSLLRLYSSESAAPQPSSDADPKLITAFSDLTQLGVHERLIRAITHDMKYKTMTDVQAMTINPALAGKDIVAQAKTGTGKTLAFLVPIIQRIIAGEPALAQPRSGRARSDDIRAIILSPTRELAEQIGVEARRLCKGTGVVVQTAVGGTQKNLMLRKTRVEGCHLMVATPGRLHDILSDTSTGIDAPRLAALVLDEADRMLDVGFKAELESILTFLPGREDVPRQTLLYSATLPKNVVGLARQFINPTNFEFVQTVKADEVPTHERVPQFIIPCRGFENLAPTLLALMRREIRKTQEDTSMLPFKAIVFLPTTASVMYYSYLFRRLKHNDRSLPYIWDIHSKLSQAQRTRSADEFRGTDAGILFSSDVSARGMDFPNVSHVIQLHLPQERDLYIHRIGRTGRAGKQGEAYLLASDTEIPSARDRLPGLPIQRCADFESASVDVSNPGTLPNVFAEVQTAAKKIPYEMLNDTYTSFLGGALRDVPKQDVVNEVNNMAKYTWGMEEPPAVSPRIVANFGGRIRGLRVGDSPRTRLDRPGGSRGFGGRGDRRSDDGFSMMERLSRSENSSRRRAPPASF